MEYLGLVSGLADKRLNDQIGGKCGIESRSARVRSPDRRFPRSARLLNGKDYAAVFHRHRRYSDRYWTILVRYTDSTWARLGMAIAKKRARRAVDRHRIKRTAREAFRHHRQSLQGCELVVMNRDAAVHASATELRQGIDRLFLRLARHSKGSGSS